MRVPSGFAELGGSALLCFDGTTSERKGIDHNCGKLNQKMMTNGHHEAIPPLGTVQIVDKTAATLATANQATVSQLRELAGEFDESAGFADKNGTSLPFRRACLTMQAGVNGAVHRELQTQRERERGGSTFNKVQR